MERDDVRVGQRVISTEKRLRGMVGTVVMILGDGLVVVDFEIGEDTPSPPALSFWPEQLTRWGE